LTQLVKDIFEEYDKDKSGKLEKSEVFKLVVDLLIRMGRPTRNEAEVGKIFEKVF
jgi:Ca2+-binding EF-hand superfamily protein